MKIGIIGSDGIPARYGGFETFVEQVAPRLAAEGHHVVVIGSALGRDAPPPSLSGIQIVNLPMSANGVSSILFDIVSFWKVRSCVDAVLILGVSAGLFLPLFRLFSGGRSIVVNVDGLEARRAKWTGFRRWFLAASERVAVAYADQVVSDNEGITNIVAERLGRRALTIAYGHDHVIQLARQEALTLLAQRAGLGLASYCLTVARIEPENNIGLMIAGFLASPRERYVIVGNFSSTDYGRHLKEVFGAEPRLALLDATYDPLLLAALRGQCEVYLHGHSVGGTNPSLVEMLPYERPIMAFDCRFNRYTLRESGGYFTNAADLTTWLKRSDLSALTPPPTVRLDPAYTWETIAQQYVVALTPDTRKRQ